MEAEKQKRKADMQISKTRAKLIAEQQRTAVLQKELENRQTQALPVVSDVIIINVKNCSLYTLLTATDLKPQKS